MDDLTAKEQELEQRIAKSDEQLKEAKKIKAPAVFIKSVKDNRDSFVKELEKLKQAKSTHWYYKER